MGFPVPGHEPGHRFRGAGSWAAALGLAVFLGCGGEPGSGGESGEEAEDDVNPFEVGTYLHIVAPSVIGRGEETTLDLRIVTQAGIPDADFEGAFRIEANSSDVKFPENGLMEPTADGSYQMKGIVFESKGVHFLRGSVPGDTVMALANPVVVRESPEYQIYWGDLNGQSDVSSGDKSPGLFFWYARSVALLDFVALTDNDRTETADGGTKTLENETFLDVCEVAKENEVAGDFVILTGFEWTSREFGSRLVYFSDVPDELPTVAAGYDSPVKLRDALPPGSVVALAHPSGSAESAPTDPGAAGSGGARLAEIYSARGSFELAASPRPTSQATPGAMVQDLLNRGLVAGFIASTDTPFSTPGNPRILATPEYGWPGGLTAVIATELTREAILEALHERRCYATTGPRFLLEFTVDGRQMGSELRVPHGHRAEVYGSLGSTSKWVRVEIIGSQGSLATLAPEGPDADVVELTATTPSIEKREWVYLRGIDEAGAMAWSSPVFLLPE